MPDENGFLRIEPAAVPILEAASITVLAAQPGLTNRGATKDITPAVARQIVDEVNTWREIQAAEPNVPAIGSWIAPPFRWEWGPKPDAMRRCAKRWPDGIQPGIGSVHLLGAFSGSLYDIIPYEQVVRTSQMAPATFWTWAGRLPEAGGGIWISFKVPVFRVKGDEE